MRGLLFGVIFAFVLLSGCSTEQVLVDESSTVPADYFKVYGFTGTEGAVISVEFEVISGGNVDLFLMNEGGYEEYQGVINGTGSVFHYYVAGSVLNTQGKNYEFELPSDGTYYIVIDNLTSGVEGEATPSDDVTFQIKVIGK